MASEPLRLTVFRPTMAGGGADRMTLVLLAALPRDRFRPQLVLLRREGPFLDDVPADVPVVELGAAHLRTGWWALARHLRAAPPDVLLSTSGGGNVAAALAWRLAGRPGRLVLSERGHLRRGSAGGPKRRLLTALKRRLYPAADRVLAVSAGVRDELIERLGLPAERVAVAYNPVVTSELPELAAAPLEHPWFGGERPVVLAAGRLVPEKDFENLLRAFTRLPEELEARLVILGDGPLRGELEALAGRLGVASRVDLPGFDKNPFRYMARSTVFVLSSRFEGLPGVLIQALACGAPAIATDCPSGPAEIVRDGETGRLVPVGDAQALADAISGLLADPGERARLAEAGRRSVERFRVERVLDGYLEALAGGEGAG